MVVKINYIAEYHKKIQDGEINVGAYIRQVYAYVVKGLEKGNFGFDEKKAQLYIDFMQTFCRQYEGSTDLLKLSLWQKAFISCVFGIMNKEGFRQFSEVLLVVARKNGKTFLSSAIMTAMAFLDNEPGAKMHCVAPLLDQSEKAFEGVLNMIRADGELRNYLVKRRDKLEIYKTESAALAAKSPKILKKSDEDEENSANKTIISRIAMNSKHNNGYNPYFCLFDELAEWEGNKGDLMYKAMTSATGGRNQPLMLSATTGGYEQHGIYDQLIEQSISFLNGESKLKRFLPFLYMIEDENKWDDLTELEKSNPNMGISPKRHFYYEQIEKARLSLTQKAEFISKFANLQQANDSAWLKASQVNDMCDCKYTLEHFRGFDGVGGVDLSKTTDLTCACVLIEYKGIKYCFAKFFMPNKYIQEAEIRDNLPYRVYAAQGLVELCDGAMVDFNRVVEWFLKIRDEYKINVPIIGYDNAMAGYFADEMRKRRYIMDDVRQGFNLSAVMRDFEGEILENRVKLCNNNLLKAHFLDVGITHDLTSDKIRPVKIEARKHIDGFVAVVDAVTIRHKHDKTYGMMFRNEGKELLNVS
ncbi:terminase [Clostridia bacterium]|nr:terminase [Clostridia bacterium]